MKQKICIFYFIYVFLLLFHADYASAQTATINIQNSCDEKSFEIRVEPDVFNCTLGQAFKGEAIKVDAKSTGGYPCVYNVRPKQRQTFQNIFSGNRAAGPIQPKSGELITVTCKLSGSACECKMYK